MKKVSVNCRGIRLAYGSTEVLRDVNLDIAPGEFFALLGPSGSGKSSLLRLIAGFNRDARGQLLLDGQDISALQPWQRPVGLVFQNYALWPHLSVWDNVAFGLVERRLDRAQVDRRVRSALELVGLAAFAQRRPSQLSGGQQQRVALARTLVVEPQVLLLDEPLSNLDKTLRVQMRQELLSLQRRLGLTTIFVTHDQEEAMTTADRMAVLDQGVVQQVGTPMQLYDEPVNAFVAHFVGTMNALPAVVSAAAVATGDGLASACEVEVLGVRVTLRASPAAQPWRPASAVWLCSRPHHALLAEPDRPLDSQHLWLDGLVQEREFLGEFVRYRLALPAAHATLLQVDEPHRAGRVLRATGQAARVGIDLSQVRLLPR